MNMKRLGVILYLVKLLTNTNYNNPPPIISKNIDIINIFQSLKEAQDTSIILRNSIVFGYNIKINNKD